MQEENKVESINYWSRIASHWSAIAYEGIDNLQTFPSSLARHEIVIDEIIKSGQKSAHILDIGCADGRLVIALIKAGFANTKGIDNAPGMVTVAKQQLAKECPDKNPDEVFFVGDADNIFFSETFDFITAMGLIEYVKDPVAFLKDLYKFLAPTGTIYLESMNKLFNLFSANAYTKNSNISQLLQDLESIKHLSLISTNLEVEAVVKDMFISIGENLKKLVLVETKTKPEFEKYPFSLLQYTPKEIITMAESCQLCIDQIIYYHCHPFAPVYEKSMPRLFNTIGLLMRPLGYTPLGALICSAFIAKISKQS